MSEPETTTECGRYEAEWNRLLDGEQTALSPACAAHAPNCHRCAALRRGFVAIKSYRGPALPPVSPAFAARVLRKRDSSARQFRRRMVLGFTIAASLAVAVSLRQWPRPTPDRNPNANAVAVKPPRGDALPAEVDLRRAAQQWREIGTDVASATRRAAGTPLQVSGKLLAMQPLRDIDALHGFEPVASVLTHAGESAYDSFEPLRKTAEMNFKSLWQGKSQSQQ